MGTGSCLLQCSCPRDGPTKQHVVGLQAGSCRLQCSCPRDGPAFFIAWTLQMVYVNQHVCDAYQSHCASHRHAGLEALMHMTLVLLSLLRKTCPKSKPRLTNDL